MKRIVSILLLGMLVSGCSSVKTLGDDVAGALSSVADAIDPENEVVGDDKK